MVPERVGLREKIKKLIHAFIPSAPIFLASGDQPKQQKRAVRQRWAALTLSLGKDEASVVSALSSFRHDFASLSHQGRMRRLQIAVNHRARPQSLA